MTAVSANTARPAWVDLVKRYTVPDPRKSTWQLINSLVPFFAIWVLMILSLSVSYLLTLVFAFLAALFMMRIFIIQHDCGHNSFFKSTRLNNLVGTFLGVLTLTPYYAWRNSHAKHHASAGDLDFRGFGDIETLTVDEYRALPLLRKLRYRFYRHPLVMFVVGPTILFTLFNRFPTGLGVGQAREKKSVYFTNLCLAAIFLGLGALIGFTNLLITWLPMMVFGSSIGVYLFYVQHQFEDTYWRWHTEWDYAEAALRGSSFFKLPRLLQWFSGNIGFHHLHHLNPKIPNYNLEQAHYENPSFQQVQTITLFSSFKSIFLHVWDEQTHKLISWREYARRSRMQITAG
ncbi:MAG: fatty acid desaturase [Anaerolineales bacterium]